MNKCGLLTTTTVCVRSRLNFPDSCYYQCSAFCTGKNQSKLSYTLYLRYRGNSICPSTKFLSIVWKSKNLICGQPSLNLTQCAAPQTDVEQSYPQQSGTQLLCLKSDRWTQLVKVVGLLFPNFFNSSVDNASVFSETGLLLGKAVCSYNKTN